MIKAVAIFSGFSVDNLLAARQFYTQKLGLKLHDETMGLHFELPRGGALFVYEKPGHQPATYTMLNFVVDDIDAAVDSLTADGIVFEQYEGIQQDKKRIARGRAANMGPDIAWLKDPAGNIIAILGAD